MFDVGPGMLLAGPGTFGVGPGNLAAKSGMFSLEAAALFKCPETTPPEEPAGWLATVEDSA